MKTLWIIIPAMFFSTISHAQTVPSSCTAPDSIARLYRDDALRMTVNRFVRNNQPFADSILIPTEEVTPVWDALIAVYNATTLAARDTVVKQFDIHTTPRPSLNAFSIVADSTLSWMQELSKGHIPTGNAEVDSLLLNYHIKIESYFRMFGSEANHWVFFVSDSSFNTRALSKAFEKINGVVRAETEFAIGDGNYIIDSIYNDHIELIYSLGWGDCPAGCTQRRFWKFNVYPDCSVEFAGSYGDVITYTGIKEWYHAEPVVYPNPFEDDLRVENTNGPFRYTLIDENGKEIAKGATDDKIDCRYDTLKGGLYILRIESHERTSNIRVIRSGK